MQKKILIIQTGNASQKFCDNNFNFSDMVIKGCELSQAAFTVINIFKDELLPENFQMIAGVVITGSIDMVTDRLPWMLRAETWLRKAREHQIPVLGICFGHQLLAQAFGGVVGYHPEGMEAGTTLIELTSAGEKDFLLQPLKQTFLAYVIHAQSVLVLPSDAELLAKSSYEPHHAFKLPPHIYGVQFHPEFTAEVMTDSISTIANKEAIKEPTPEEIERADHETESGYMLLRQFIKLCGERQ